MICSCGLKGPWATHSTLAKVASRGRHDALAGLKGATNLTADTITDAHILALREELFQKKHQNAYTRAIRKDCDGALAGSPACRESCAAAWNRRHEDRSLMTNTPTGEA